MNLIKETKDSVVKDKTIITNIVDKQFNELDVLHEKYLKVWSRLISYSNYISEIIT